MKERLELLAQQMRESSYFKYIKLNKQFGWIRFTAIRPLSGLKVRYELYKSNNRFVLFDRNHSEILKEFPKNVKLSEIMKFLNR